MRYKETMARQNKQRCRNATLAAIIKADPGALRERCDTGEVRKQKACRSRGKSADDFDWGYDWREDLTSEPDEESQ